MLSYRDGYLYAFEAKRDHCLRGGKLSLLLVGDLCRILDNQDGKYMCVVQLKKEEKGGL